MIFYFIRHGEILSNTKKVYAGWSDEGLTLRGRRQAEQVAKKLFNIRIDAIYTSPLRRAIQTAEIIGTYLNLHPILEESFIEHQLGLWEGLSEDDIARDYKEEWEIWNKRPQDLMLHGRETLNQLLKRVLSGIKKISAVHPQGSIAIVTHVAVIRVVYLFFRGMRLNKYKTISVPNGGIFSIVRV